MGANAVYNWVRTKLQEYGAVAMGSGRGVHRKRRQPAAWPGIQVGLRHIPQLTQRPNSAYIVVSMGLPSLFNVIHEYSEI